MTDEIGSPWIDGNFDKAYGRGEIDLFGAPKDHNGIGPTFASQVLERNGLLEEIEYYQGDGLHAKREAYMTSYDAGRVDLKKRFGIYEESDPDVILQLDESRVRMKQYSRQRFQKDNIAPEIFDFIWQLGLNDALLIFNQEHPELFNK